MQPLYPLALSSHSVPASIARVVGEAEMQILRTVTPDARVRLSSHSYPQGSKTQGRSRGCEEWQCGNRVHSATSRGWAGLSLCFMVKGFKCHCQSSTRFSCRFPRDRKCIHLRYDNILYRMRAVSHWQRASKRCSTGDKVFPLPQRRALPSASTSANMFTCRALYILLCFHGLVTAGVLAANQSHTLTLNGTGTNS